MVAVDTRYSDLAKSLSSMLTRAIDGLRVYPYIPDTFRPPGAVIALPQVDYRDTQSGFCKAAWVFPISLIVARTSEREAQAALSDLLGDTVKALAADPADGIFSVEPMDAIPASVSVNGQELPAYNLRVLVRA